MSKKASKTSAAKIDGNPDAEHQRMQAQNGKTAAWDRWGPYLSERQWGTVREDYSAHGEAWDYFSHELARSRAYRLGAVLLHR